ncbi:MAG: hypothetical protein K8R58_02870, partial [Bacteroidales bacterium]|nr:hypothetical protein [Bacteroidales bacterium]
NIYFNLLNPGLAIKYKLLLAITSKGIVRQKYFPSTSKYYLASSFPSVEMTLTLWTDTDYILLFTHTMALLLRYKRLIRKKNHTFALFSPPY